MILRSLLTIAVLANLAATAVTFFVPDVLTGPAVMNGSARGTALVMLVAGLPVLLVAFALEDRGVRWAAVMRLGALAYLAYNDFMLLFATPFNSLFLAYVVALSSTAFALGLGLATSEPQLVHHQLARTPSRVVGGYIWVIVVLNELVWLRTIVPAMFAANPGSFMDGSGIATNPVFVQDLVFWLPSAALIGWLAWAGRSWGVLLAGTYLVYGLLESIGVAVDQWFGSSADPSSTLASMDAVWLFGVLAGIGVVALAFYARSLTAARD
jgi:hypothetical protein